MEKFLQKTDMKMDEQPVEVLHGMGIYVVYGNLDGRRQEVTQFWLENKAIQDAEEAQRRVKEVVCLALDGDGRIAGVSSVYKGALGKERETYWFYRTFIRPDARYLGIVSRLFRGTFEALETNAEEDQVKGLAVVTENRRLTRIGVHKLFVREGMVKLGATSDGKDVWKRDFKFP